MIDVHSHILFDIDDGAREIEESIFMLKESQNAGFTDVILTPHYMEGVYAQNKEEVINRFKKLKEEIKDQGLEINIYLGNEVYVTPNINEKILTKEVLTLNNSKYVLIETHLTTNILYLEHEIDKMLEAGFKPILAHPERYEFVKKDIKNLDKFINKGVLLQSNYGSIVGFYGKTAEKTVRKLLKTKAITFLASDTHFVNTIYAAMPDIKRKLQSVISDEYFYDITEYNAREIIN